MYLLTFEEKYVNDQRWHKTCRDFESKKHAREYMECLYESKDIRYIHLWEVSEIPHKCKLHVKVSFDGE